MYVRKKTDEPKILTHRDLNGAQKRMLLAQIEQQFGSEVYSQMKAAVGEDGVIDRWLDVLNNPTRQSAPSPQRRFRLMRGDADEAAGWATWHTIFFPFLFGSGDVPTTRASDLPSTLANCGAVGMILGLLSLFGWVYLIWSFGWHVLAAIPALWIIEFLLFLCGSFFEKR